MTNDDDVTLSLQAFPQEFRQDFFIINHKYLGHQDKDRSLRRFRQGVKMESDENPLKKARGG